MRTRTPKGRLAAAFALIALLLLGSTLVASAQQAKALHSFTGGADGQNPIGGVAIDGSGNLYGTTVYGGTDRYGTVFELTPAANGTWTHKVLYSFLNDGKDGIEPEATVVLDAKGNLYGTTYYGGTYGFGTVFELSPVSGGGWSEKVLHSFNHTPKDGYEPYFGVTLDAAGNVYGTTEFGGAYNVGAVFELSPNTSGGWTETIIHSFRNNGTDAYWPLTRLTIDAAGNIYGTTIGGTTHLGYGTVFELSPRTGGGWTEKVLHNFTATTDGIAPYGGVALDSLGNLYGTAWQGGTYGNGTVFEMSPGTNGSWTEAPIFNFNGSDGSQPFWGVSLDALGNLYGTTALGGGSSGRSSIVFELSRLSGENWTEKILYTYGAGLSSGVIADSKGNVYGMTYGGGAYSDGAVFEVTP